MRCDHGITLASYVERCVECGVEVVHRPPEEASLRAELERFREALHEIQAVGRDDLGRELPGDFTVACRDLALAALAQDQEHP